MKRTKARAISGTIFGVFLLIWVFIRGSSLIWSFIQEVKRLKRERQRERDYGEGIHQ